MALPDPEAARAILIGTAHYAPDSGFESFPEVERSLRDFAEFLRTETGLPEQHIEMVLDPPDSRTIAARVTAAAQAASGLLLVYYVGHGVAVDNQLHLTHVGSRATDADVTALGYPIVRSRIKANARGPVVVILDCCHSGRAFGRDVLAIDGEPLRAATDIDGAFVLTATDEKTKFARAKGEGGRTAFTGMLLDTLRTGTATDDRYLTMSLLYRELRDRLPAANLPKPKALERGTAGQLALAENPRWTGRSHPAGLPPAATSVYMAQIRDIAPADGLADRDAELTELADFCRGDEPYVWWQAGPWAGKTALMSWFALNPPPDVRVVAFFITSRMADQDDYRAFTDAVLEQLSALLPDQAATVASTTGGRDALRRHLLAVAAERAADAGQRIVLLVDGLDEDRGRTSIASLLPKNPGPGLRVIVAGRPNPGLPLDVPAAHPLRHCRRRELGPSAKAFDIRDAAQLELRGILERSDADQQILGLVTAARGLTGTELEDLTGWPPFRIETILSGVTGRTFRVRTSRFGPAQVYLLAHETLQREAETTLGRALMEQYRQRFHAWAERYRDRGWPVETPTFLLTRYFSMLRRQGDMSRMTALALDTARHDRLLLLSGSDQIARTEIATVSGIWLEQRDPDLVAVGELALRRHRLTQRGWDIPLELPAALANLGELARGRRLADGILDPSRRLRARIGVVATQLLRGRSQHNQELVDSLRESETAVVGGADLRRLVDALIAVPDFESAERVAGEITTPADRVRVLARLIPAWTEAGRLAAIDAAKAEIDRHVVWVSSAERDDVLRFAVRAYAAIGEYERVDELSGDSESVVVRMVALAAVARSLAERGNTDSAEGHVRSIRSELGDVVSQVVRARLLSAIADDMVAAGFGDMLRAEVDAVLAGVEGWRAELEAANTGYEVAFDDAISGIVDYPWGHIEAAVVELARCLVALGDADRVVALGHRFARGTSGLAVSSRALSALLAADRTADARRLAAEIELHAYQRTDPRERDLVLYAMVRALAAAGERTRALVVAERVAGKDHQFLSFIHLGAHASESGRHIDVFLDRTLSAMRVAASRAGAGYLRTDRLFLTAIFATNRLGGEPVSDTHTPVAELVRMLLARGSVDSVRELIDELVTVYHGSIEPIDGLARGLAGLVMVLADAEQPDTARELIHWIAFAPVRLTARMTSAGGLWTEPSAVAGLLDDAAQTAVALRTIAEQGGSEFTAVVLARVRDDAEQAVAAGDSPDVLANRIVRALFSAAVGDAEAVTRLLTCQWTPALAQQRVTAMLASSMARAGAVDEALTVAEDLTDDYALSVTYREAAAALVRAGRELDALRLCDRIPLPGHRIRALAPVIPAQAASGTAERARSTLSAATPLLDEITSSDAHDRAIAPLIDAALAINALDHALEIARAAAPEIRGAMLTRIADSLVHAYPDVPPGHQGATRRTIRRLLAEAWSSAPWYTLLDTVAHFDPVLLVGITDEALRLDSLERMTNQTTR
ncbi:caspase family protein [Nocardia tengchongensis]|uniref:Caspase family protein n=1 Tax=Nocardia tengchongensis TaxID=2055889 RepID=A0ABX8CHF0_9NOCA|nr:caspase family protein [Nocardia tengchongensis]QVI18974.1 caspase family protein [Nocardia tengchongensis]